MPTDADGGAGRGRGAGTATTGRGGGGRTATAGLGRSGGRGGRGRGRGRGRGGRGSGPNLTGLPDAWKVWHIDSWVNISQPNTPYDFSSEEEYADKHQSHRLRDTYMQLANGPSDACRSAGAADTPTNRFLQLLPNKVVEVIVENTNQQLALNGKVATNQYEFRRFIATLHLRSRYSMSTEKAFSNDMSYVAERHKFVLMEYKRFTEILTNIRGYPMVGRSGADNDVWNQRQNTLRKMNTLEKAIFEPIIQMLLNKKSGILSMDDELIGSRAKDVEKKTLSNRKADGEGPVVDAICCALTSVPYAMRLRITGESEVSNVVNMMETIPPITNSQHDLGASFDRGYGKPPFMEPFAKKNIKVTTIAGAAGSKHPFITQEEVATKIKEWTSKGVEEQERNRRVQLVNDWVLPDVPMQGSVVSIAKRTVEYTTDDKQKGTGVLYAIAFYETYAKQPGWLRIFTTDPKIAENPNSWVAKEHRKITLNSTVLFSNHKPSSDRMEIEAQLNLRCGPLTLAQVSADWFQHKTHRISGTMAGTLCSSTVDITDESILAGDDEEGALSSLFDKCMNSWYARHKDNLSDKTKSVMAQGSKNEVPIIDNLRNQCEWMICLTEVGLLELKGVPFIAVSPDGVAKFKFDGMDEPQFACVEAKTRQKTDTTIAAAEASAHKHGHEVMCTYDDDVFRDNVPSGNRKQVMHQAFVTGLDYGIFVTAKLESGEGSIVQITVVEIPSDAKVAYGQKILPLSEKLCGWLHSAALLNRGYLIDDDFPPWISDVAKETLSSRYQMWAAFNNKVHPAPAGDVDDVDDLMEMMMIDDVNAGDGTTADTTPDYSPTKPLFAIKHLSQYNYNKSKGGLDKNTEISKHIDITTQLSFESKYVLRMLSGIKIAQWRVEIGSTIVKPLVNRLIQDGQSPPSATRIRTAAYNLSFDDFLYDSSIEMLVGLESLQLRVPIIPAVPGPAAREHITTARDVEISNIIRARGSKWPVDRYKIREFGMGGLTKLRLHQSNAFPHTPIPIPSRGKNTEVRRENRLNCAMCSKTKKMKNTSNFCPTCKVPLCTSLLPNVGATATCFEVWHSSSNLASDHQICHLNLLAHYANTAAAKTNKRRRRQNAGDDDDASEQMGSLAGVGPTDVTAGMFGSTDTGPAPPLDGVNPLANNRNQLPPFEDVDMNQEERESGTTAV